MIAFLLGVAVGTVIAIFGMLLIGGSKLREHEEAQALARDAER